jgi:hypothetical protein
VCVCVLIKQRRGDVILYVNASRLHSLTKENDLQVPT